MSQPRGHEAPTRGLSMLVVVLMTFILAACGAQDGEPVAQTDHCGQRVRSAAFAVGYERTGNDHLNWPRFRAQ